MKYYLACLLRKFLYGMQAKLPDRPKGWFERKRNAIKNRHKPSYKAPEAY